MNTQPLNPTWYKQYEALLGKVPDLELARRARVSVGYVKKVRLQRGIRILRNPPRPWTAAEESAAGQVTRLGSG